LGAHSAPNPDRYACTNHVLGDNARAVDRKALESRVLTGLRERMMTPEIAADAMRAYTQETNRLNRPAPKLIGIHPPRACRSRESHRGDHARHRATRMAPRPVRPADRA
jgi:hypothetical protein